MNKKIVVSNIKIKADKPFEKVLEKLYKEGVSCDLENITILKKSLDAREKSNIRYVYNLLIDGDYKLSSKHSNKISEGEIKTYKMPKPGLKKANGRHVVIGSGPAGLFAALLLARCGYKPLVVERGEMVEDRTKSVERFWKENDLNQESNVCFGEGGAGTFSDGKLNTSIKDKDGRKSFILEEFVRFGADESIKYWHKPHIGSDVLVKVVKNIREEIISLGGEFQFNTKLAGINVDNGLSVALISKSSLSFINVETLILATGHSARDIYKMLDEIGADERSKAFAVGLRIEHPQEMINISQYGEDAPLDLPVADYKLTTKSNSGRGVYTFCMCPGGKVVNSSSSLMRLCVNGMSMSGRDGRNANAAIIATVDKNDFGDDDFAGVYFQNELERRAYQIGNGRVPIQTFSDFCNGKVSNSLGDISPDILGDTSFGNLCEIFPEDISSSLMQGIHNFGNNIAGFNRGDAVLSGVESRTSSPIKIYRDEHFESNIKGIFPCGEGAGYAGGIMSAAIDGIKVAEEIIRRYQSDN